MLQKKQKSTNASALMTKKRSTYKSKTKRFKLISPPLSLRQACIGIQLVLLLAFSIFAES